MAPLRPKARGDLSVVDLDGEAVVYDQARNRLHHLNHTAALVLRLCDGTSTPRQLSIDIADAFGAPIREVERDVEEALSRFQAAGLLEARSRGGKDASEPVRGPQG